MEEKFQQILDGFKSIEEKMALSASKDEVKGLSERQAELSKQLLEIQQKGVKAAVPAETKSFGDQLVDNALFKSFAVGSASRFKMEIKAATSPMLTPTDGVIQTYRRPGVLPGVFRPFTIEALLRSAPIASNAFDYVQEKSFENGAAFVAEGAQKPSSSVSFEVKTGNIRTVAHIARISKQLLADGPALVAYLNTRMVYGVDLAVEDQIVKGDGTGQNLSGIFTAGNFTEHGASLEDVGANPTLFDLILYAKTKVQSRFFRPNVILVSPADWSKLQMVKNASGDYYLGHPAQVGGKTLWGIQVVDSPAIPEGKFVVMDTTQAATVWNREGITIEMFEQDSDNVEKNLITIRAERRVGLSVERPDAIVGGDLILPAATAAAEA
jgi:HK97 family phage major capsid protein